MKEIIDHEWITLYNSHVGQYVSTELTVHSISSREFPQKVKIVWQIEIFRKICYKKYWWFKSFTWWFFDNNGERRWIRYLQNVSVLTVTCINNIEHKICRVTSQHILYYGTYYSVTLTRTVHWRYCTLYTQYMLPCLSVCSCSYF